MNDDYGGRVLSNHPRAGGSNYWSDEAAVIRVIYKYELTGNVCEVEMPFGARMLCTHEQNGLLMLWAEVVVGDTQMETRKFQIIGTGRRFDDLGLFYIGTAYMQNGLVWHVYENRRVG